MITHPCIFENTSKEIKGNEKKAQKLKSFCMKASYVQWLVGKIINSQYQKFKKKHSKTDLSHMKINDFQPR
jgi:hypothetical protein